MSRIISEKEKRSKIESQRRIAAARTPEQKAAFDSYHREWRRKRRAQMTPEEIAEKRRTHNAYCAARKAKMSPQSLDEIKTSKRRWMAEKRASDPDHVRANARRWKKNKKATSPEYKLECALRGRLFKAAKRHGMKEVKPSTFKILGCTRAELRAHLEKQFKPGMTWDNYGYRGWHIDHIRPVSSFNLLNEDEMRACFHFTNLQPLWGILNMKKGNRFEALLN